MAGTGPNDPRERDAEEGREYISELADRMGRTDDRIEKNKGK